MLASILSSCLLALTLSTGVSVSVSALPSTSPFTVKSTWGENMYAYFQSTSNKYNENLNIFGPLDLSAQKTYPLVLFFAGFGSNMPSVAYGRLLSETSSKGNGAVVVAWDGLGVSNPLDLTGILSRTAEILAYCQGGKLQDFINKNFKKPFTVDPTQVFFAGHSSGNQIALSMGLQFPSNGLMLLDPVDSDPVGWTHPVINGTTTYDKPVMVIGSKLGEERGITAGNIVPPCCPAGFSSDHFYDAFTMAPKFYSMATMYGHADVLSPDPFAYVAHLSHFCGTVVDSDKNPFEDYRNFISGQMSAFMAANSGLRDCSYIPYLNDASTFPIATTSKSTVNSALDYC